jgi:hypothetical protein
MLLQEAGHQSHIFKFHIRLRENKQTGHEKEQM